MLIIKYLIGKETERKIMLEKNIIAKYDLNNYLYEQIEYFKNNKKEFCEMLDIENTDDKKIDPETVIKVASSSNASSGNFMTKLLGAEAAAILGSMAAATVLMLGGGKYKRRKFTKRRRNKKQKSTKSNKK